MTRSTVRRNAVQAEQSPPSSSATEARFDDGPATPPAPSTGLAWYWRLALFLWATSFAFLMLYEWLAGLVKALSRK